MGLWRLLFGKAPQDIIGAALDLEGAGIILTHAKAIVRLVPELGDFIDRIISNEIELPETGSKWKTTGREHTATRGRHASLVLYDECGWARDGELFSALLAGQASVADPLMLLTSTVGAKQKGPLWQIRELAEAQADPSIFWWWTDQNLSPLVTKQFLDRQRKILLPGEFAREHQNAWVDAADSFTSTADVDHAMGRGWIEQPQGRPDCYYVASVDIGYVHDPAVICVAHAEEEMLFVDRLLTFQGSREEPVQMADLETALLDLDRRFNLREVRIESWQGIAAVQSLERAELPVSLFHPTPKAQAEEWPLLHQRLVEKTLVLPNHARLREELINLVYETTRTGVRVVDRGRVHQDHAVTVRMVCGMLHDEDRPLDGYTAPEVQGTRETSPLIAADTRRRERRPAQEDREEPAVWGSDDREAPYRGPLG